MNEAHEAEYTPTTEQIRAEYVNSVGDAIALVHGYGADQIATAEFDRWLAAHDAELLARVRAEIETATTVGWSSFDDSEPLIRTRDALAVLDRLGEKG